MLPHTATAHQVGDDLRTDFSSNASATISVVAPDTSGDPDGLDAYASALSSLTGVTTVSSTAGVFQDGRQVAPASGPAMTEGDATYLMVRTSYDPQSDAAKTLLPDVEDVPAPWQTLYRRSDRGQLRFPCGTG